MIVTIDAKAYEIGNRIIQQDIQKAAALTLADTARWATDDFIDALKTKVDRPAPFTTMRSGYGITIAKFGAIGDALFSESYVKPAQASYLQFILDGGGIRGLGDAGASTKHAWVPGQRTATSLGGGYTANPRLSRYGGVPDGYSKTLFDSVAAFKARAGVGKLSKAQFAMTLRKAGKTTGLAAYSKGGVFFGTVDGRTGFWARPKRTAPITKKVLGRVETLFGQSFATHQRDPKTGRYIPTGRGELSANVSGRQRNNSKVVSKGVPILILQSETETHHRAFH